MKRTSRTTARRTAGIAAAVLAAVVATPAVAVADSGRDRLEAIGLTDGGKGLVYFQTDKPGKVRHISGVQGLKDGDSYLVGIDFRVQNGGLYGVGDRGGIYLLDSRDGRAMKVGYLSVALDGKNFGVDFNPAANALRVTSDRGQNLRQPFGDGDAPMGATVADGALNYPATAAAPAVNPVQGVSASAYTNNDLSADTATTLFDLDTALDQVVIQSPANAGVLAATGKLRVDAGADAGFDIYSTVRDGRTTDVQGFATLQVKDGYRLYEVDLLNGEATDRGAFGKPVTDLAIGLAQR